MHRVIMCCQQQFPRSLLNACIPVLFHFSTAGQSPAPQLFPSLAAAPVGSRAWAGEWKIKALLGLRGKLHPGGEEVEGTAFRECKRMRQASKMSYTCSK